MRVLVTGGAGFIGSNLIRHFLTEHTDVEVVNLDLLTYAGNRDNLSDVEDDPRYGFVQRDICDPALVQELVGDVDAILNLAAESDVDRSIEHDAPFVRTNVTGTHTLLSAALAAPTPPRFVQVSTDEVYGELPWSDLSEPDADAPRFTESTPLAPRSPYSATKAAGDMLALAYHHTHGLDVVITRCSNNYGPYQFPEKLIPLMVTHALEGEPLPVYGDGLNVRDWIQVEDHCRGLDLALREGRGGEVYNFGGDAERTNLQVVNAIIEQTGADPGLLTFVEDRLGHDRRYAVDSAKAKGELGWAPRVGFEEGLAETIEWYRGGDGWLASRVGSTEDEEATFASPPGRGRGGRGVDGGAEFRVRTAPAAHGGVGPGVASVPHSSFGTSVVIRPLWLRSPCGCFPPRTGASSPFSRISRSTRFLPTRIPFGLRRALTFR